MTAVYRIRAVLKFGRRRNIARILVLAKAVFAKMMADQALYAGSAGLLATLEDQTKILGLAQDAVDGKIPKATGPRNAARNAVLTTLEGLQGLVQVLADAAPPDQAIVIIESAGMSVAAVSRYAKPVLAVERGVPPGLVFLVANAGILSRSERQKTYGWQYTVNGGATWLDAAATPVAHTSIAGLPSLKECGFRVNVTDTLGTSPWSQVVTVLVY